MGTEDLGTLIARLGADIAEIKTGMREGRKELINFRDLSQTVSSQVKRFLSFAGVAVGIYELASALKSFAKEAALTGARTETLQISAEKIGQTYKMSADSVKYYVEQAKTAGITTQESLQGVSKFLTSGLPLDQLKDLATRARDIAVVAGVNTSEAFNRIIQGIITGEQETLRRMMIQVGSTEDIYKRYAATLGKTKDELNSVEKAQAMLNEVMRLSAGFAGVAAEADLSVGKQLASMARYAEEAKNALWPIFQPAFLAGVQELSQGWKDLESWAKANKERLAEWGREGALWLKDLATGIKDIGAFIAENKELLKRLAELYIASKAAGWIAGLGTEIKKTAVEVGILAALFGKLKLLIGGPWKLIITVGLFGLYEAYQKIQTLRKQAGFTPIPGDVSGAIQEGRGRDRAGEAGLLDITGAEAAREAERRGITTEKKYLEILKNQQRLNVEGRYRKFTVPDRMPSVLPEHETPDERAAREAREALELARQNAPNPPGKEKKGKDDNLLAPTMATYKAEREVAIQEAQNYFDWLKTANEKERAEQERKLAEGLIDGQTYYQGLQDLQRAETAAALAMIEQKRQAQQNAFQESLAELEADEKLSPEAKSIARRKLEAEQKKALARLDTDAAQVRLEDEKKITDELRRQVEVRKEYQQKTEDLSLETAQLTGALSEQEATVRRLTLEYDRAIEAARNAGAYTPEYAAALEANLRAKTFEGSYAGQKFQSGAQIIMSGVADFVNTITEGGAQIAEVLDQFGKKIMQNTFKLFFDDLAKAISQGIKGLANSIASEMQSTGAGGGFGGLFSGIGKWFSGLFGGAPTTSANWAHGGAFSRGMALGAFGRGGIVSRPTLFPMANGMGLMGEAGEEGILPLERIGGDLGVKALFPKPGPTQVIINNNTGVNAQGDAKMMDDGTLMVTLEKELAGRVSRGGDLAKAIQGKFNVRERF